MTAPAFEASTCRETTLPALCRAAVLVHGIHGLSVTVQQPGRAPLHVTTSAGSGSRGAGIRLHPCEFRRRVGALRQGSGSAFDGLFDVGAGVQLSMFTGRHTRMTSQGIVLHRFAGAAVVVAFAVVVPIDQVRAAGADLGASSTRPARPGVVRVDLCDDPELAAVLVHGTIPRADREAIDELLRAMGDLHAACAAAEAVHHFERLTGS